MRCSFDGRWRALGGGYAFTSNAGYAYEFDESPYDPYPSFDVKSHAFTLRYFPFINPVFALTAEGVLNYAACYYPNNISPFKRDKVYSGINPGFYVRGSLSLPGHIEPTLALGYGRRVKRLRQTPNERQSQFGLCESFNGQAVIDVWFLKFFGVSALADIYFDAPAQPVANEWPAKIYYPRERVLGLFGGFVVNFAGFKEYF